MATTKGRTMMKAMLPHLSVQIDDVNGQFAVTVTHPKGLTLKDCKVIAQNLEQHFWGPPRKQRKRQQATDALCGLPAFATEQVCAMSTHKAGIDLNQLWKRKRQLIEQLPGLAVRFGSVRQYKRARTTAKADTECFLSAAKALYTERGIATLLNDAEYCTLVTKLLAAVDQPGRFHRLSKQVAAREKALGVTRR